jgi:hypothetical protein
MVTMKELGTEVGHLKAGFLGFQGTGKTYTATDLAIGTRAHFGLDGPIGFLDTEASAQYIVPRVLKATGKRPIGAQTRSLSDAIDFLIQCVEKGVSVAIIDSVTHLWREVCNSFVFQRNEARIRMNRPTDNRIEFQEWKCIKDKWAVFADLYLNSPIHAIISGRAGYEYDYEDRDDETGKKDLVKTGIKMKTEGEFGFEPSLVVQMERIDTGERGKPTGRYVRRATIIKDRFDVLDGMECDNPTFDFFRPYVALLTPGAHVTVDTTMQTYMGVDENGSVEWQREKKARTIAFENLSGLLLREWPGQGSSEKLARQEICWRLLGTRSITEVENTSAAKLKDAIKALPEVVAAYRVDVSEKEQADLRAEADAKVSKKTQKVSG